MFKSPHRKVGISIGHLLTSYAFGVRNRVNLFQLLHFAAAVPFMPSRIPTIPKLAIA